EKGRPRGEGGASHAAGTLSASLAWYGCHRRILQYSNLAPTVSPRQETIAQSLRAVHLNSLRSRLLVLALLATPIPTVAILSPFRHVQPSVSDTAAQPLRWVRRAAPGP